MHPWNITVLCDAAPPVWVSLGADRVAAGQPPRLHAEKGLRRDQLGRAGPPMRRHAVDRVDFVAELRRTAGVTPKEESRNDA